MTRLESYRQFWRVDAVSLECGSRERNVTTVAVMSFFWTGLSNALSPDLF